MSITFFQVKPSYSTFFTDQWNRFRNFFLFQVNEQCISLCNKITQSHTKGLDWTLRVFPKVNRGELLGPFEIDNLLLIHLIEVDVCAHSSWHLCISCIRIRSRRKGKGGNFRVCRTWSFTRGIKEMQRERWPLFSEWEVSTSICFCLFRQGLSMLLTSKCDYLLVSK